MSYPMPIQQPPVRRRGLVIGVGILVAAVLIAGAGFVWVVMSYRSQTAGAAVPASFRNADEVVSYLAAHKLPCGPVQHVDRPVNATSLIDCGDAIVVAVYSRHEDALGSFDEMAATLRGVDAVHMAIGSNWTVSSEQPPYAQAVAKLLRAEYKTT